MWPSRLPENTAPGQLGGEKIQRCWIPNQRATHAARTAPRRDAFRRRDIHVGATSDQRLNALVAAVA
jgi:hypothetical protein